MVEHAALWLILSFFAVLLLMAARVYVAVALIIVGFGGTIIVMDWNVAVGVIKAVFFEFAASWSLSSIAMYLIMGYFAFEGGMAAKIYDAVRLLFSRVPGAIPVTTSFASAGFGAICGSSGATAATFAKMAVPEMIKDGYDHSLALGSVAAAGTMGSLMPPSVLMIVYAVLVEESVGACFLAGVFPCILSAAIYAAMIVIRCKLNPKLAPHSVIEAPSLRQKIKAIFGVWDVLVLVIIVFGGIFSGIFTATEAGAAGAFCALLMGICRRLFGMKTVKTSLLEAARVTCTVLLIGVGANVYVRFMALTGLTEWLEIQTTGMSQLTLMGSLFLVFFVLGMFLDPIGIMLLTVPILDPILDNIGISKIWFCVLLIKQMELALITPPVGLNIYIVKGVVGDEYHVETIFRGIFWFAVMDIITLGILYLFPQISMFLPNSMMRQ